MKKIAVVTCYHDPDYVRARSLRAAFKAQPGVELVVIKNSKKGLGRYFQVLWKMLQVKRTEKPAAFLITFRGQEILPFALLIAGRTPVWFDEFIVPSAYARHERHRRTFKSIIKKMGIKAYEPLYRFCLRRCSAILLDTEAHTDLSARLNRVNHRKYIAVPVGTDEKLFYPKLTKKVEPLQIMYYTTNMQPLHGVEYVIEAAEMLQNDERFQFLLIGGKKRMRHAVEAAVQRGARISYRPWVAFEELPKLMGEAGINLGGPFGGSPQAQLVITGKTFQSLASAVPTVVGENEATKPYFQDKINAFVVPQQSAEALVKIYKWAYDNPKSLEQIGQNGRKLYDKSFSKTAIAKRIAPLVDTVRSH